MDQPNLDRPAPQPAPQLNSPAQRAGLGLLGLALAAAGAFWTWNTHAFAGRAALAEGEITGYQEKRESDKVMYAAMISFKTPEARTVAFTSKVSTSYRGADVGSSVPILYDPQNPEKAVIKSFTQMWLFPIVLTAVGLLLMAGAALAPRREGLAQSTGLAQSP